MADGDLTRESFDVAFAFSRPAAASYRGPDGETIQAAANAPRFDHDPDGNPLGLLVEPGAALGQADRAVLDPLMLPADIAGQEVTVFHAQTDPGGTVHRRAWYSKDARATINGLLSSSGRHGAIGVIMGYRENKGGLVRYRAQSWYLPDAIRVDENILLGDAAMRPLVEG